LLRPQIHRPFPERPLHRRFAGRTRHDQLEQANVAITREKTDAIFNKMTAYLQQRDIFVFDGYAGADEKYALPVRIINELASSALCL
jgi:ATP-dependent phosphoenolpyruvate carboxykinase